MWPQLERLVSDLCRRRPDGLVLEVGTGSGGMFAYLLELMSSDGGLWRLITVDYDPQAIAQAQRRLLTYPAAVRRRVETRREDVVETARALPGAFDGVVASALLSAASLTGPLAQDRVLVALAGLVRRGGWVAIEDYLPLPQPAGLATATPAAAANALWRLDKALAELGGRSHHQELPPALIADRLRQLGIASTYTTDDCQAPRDEATALGVAASDGLRPPHLDTAAWAALDRYRRDLLRAIGAMGLVQWSGWFRLIGERL